MFNFSFPNPNNKYRSVGTTNTAVSEHFQNAIEKWYKEANSIPLAHITAHIPGLA